MTPTALYEMHSHTPLCKHAVGEPVEYARVAEQRGLAGLTVTCHNPMPQGFGEHVRMSIDEFDDYVELVEAARQHWSGRVDVQLGLEADYFPGYEAYLERQLGSSDFHYVLGSVHPQLAEFRQAYWNDDPIAFQRVYFAMLADAAETGLFDCLAHPDLVKNETVADWNPQEIMADICRALDRIAATGVSMEVNTSGANKRIPQINPFPAMLQEMHRRSIPVVIGSDAHDPSRVGDRFVEALDLVASCGYTHVGCFRRRERRELAIASVRRGLVSDAA